MKREDLVWARTFDIESAESGRVTKGHLDSEDLAYDVRAKANVSAIARWFPSCIDTESKIEKACEVNVCSNSFFS